MEGVMMRGPHFWTVAVRQPDGQIVLKDHRIKSALSKSRILKLPLLRGVIALIENLIIGFKALNFSASISTGQEAEEKLSPVQISSSFLIAVVMVIGLFMAIPFFVTKLTRSVIENRIAFTLIEGFIRISIFIGYIYIISLIKDIRRVFQYHGAEHKAVNAFENKENLTAESASKYSTIHLRCGTNFVLIVFILAVAAFSFLPTSSFFFRVGGKILLAPVIAGLAYEVIRKASKTKSKFIRAIIAPGLLLQKITTKEPGHDQVEVALVALKKVLELENNYAEKVHGNS